MAAPPRQPLLDRVFTDAQHPSDFPLAHIFHIEEGEHQPVPGAGFLQGRAYVQYIVPVVLFAFLGQKVAERYGFSAPQNGIAVIDKNAYQPGFEIFFLPQGAQLLNCLLYTSPSPRD